MRSREILDELAEFHLAVGLPRHINHINDFVATYVRDKYSSAQIRSDCGTRHSCDKCLQLLNCCCVEVGFKGVRGLLAPPCAFQTSSLEGNWHNYGSLRRNC